MREFAGGVLRAAGFGVLEASNGDEAIAVAREHIPHLVISDVIMEHGDGYAALEALRRTPATAHVPIVLMTANADLKGMRHGMSLGADDYLPKPFSAAGLLACVDTQFRKQDLLRSRADKELETLRSNLHSALPHEFNTPLNGIIGAAQLLRDDCAQATPETIAELADCILESGNRLYRVARNYLIYAEAELCDSDPAKRAMLARASTKDLGEHVAALARDLAVEYQRTADLRLAFAPQVAAAIAEGHWRKIVEELVQNAFKFSPAGTPVQVALAEGDGRIRLTVRDEGRGMSPAQIARIGAYTQFDRKEQEHQGLGLGLAIARRLARLYQGSVDIQSAPARGTTVTVSLPG